jgi:hypothetical protein
VVPPSLRNATFRLGLLAPKGARSEVLVKAVEPLKESVVFGPGTIGLAIAYRLAAVQGNLSFPAIVRSRRTPYDFAEALRLN